MGLGPAKDVLSGRVIEKNHFQHLSQFDEEKGFTPIVDGNQFMLSNSEETSEKPRRILVYGGGGTAAAVYRKGSFGTDVRTEDRPYTEKTVKNKTYWYSRSGFDKAGKGKLVTHAMKNADDRGELGIAELTKIEENKKTGALLLTFKAKNQNPFTLEVDQLVHSTGQDDVTFKKICSEFESELTVEKDSSGMPLSVASKDKAIRFFGAGAMAVRPQTYADGTWDWLDTENIGRDVGPGSMPPTRAQIKKHLLDKGVAPKHINVNIDCIDTMKAFFEKANIAKTDIKEITSEFISLRTNSSAGFSKKTLENTIHKYGIDGKVKVSGHGHLILC